MSYFKYLNQKQETVGSEMANHHDNLVAEWLQEVRLRKRAGEDTDTTTANEPQDTETMDMAISSKLEPAEV